jgi:hypothetical protein
MMYTTTFLANMKLDKKRRDKTDKDRTKAIIGIIVCCPAKKVIVLGSLMRR